MTCTVPAVTDGTANPTVGNEGNYGTAYTVTCDTGYELTGGMSDESGACGTDGNFASPAPTCESKSIPKDHHFHCASNSVFSSRAEDHGF